MSARYTLYPESYKPSEVLLKQELLPESWIIRWQSGFHNMSLDICREDLIRSVFEGVAYNVKWGI